MSRKITKSYTNDEITVVWKPDMCVHSAICIAGLPAVFNARKRPWINIHGASTEEIIAQVRECPSGALFFYHNGEGSPASGPKEDQSTRNEPEQIRRLPGSKE